MFQHRLISRIGSGLRSIGISARGFGFGAARQVSTYEVFDRLHHRRYDHQLGSFRKFVEKTITNARHLTSYSAICRGSLQPVENTGTLLLFAVFGSLGSHAGCCLSQHRLRRVRVRPGWNKPRVFVMFVPIALYRSGNPVTNEKTDSQGSGTPCNWPLLELFSPVEGVLD